MLEWTNSDSGVSSWMSAVTVGQNIQKPAATSDSHRVQLPDLHAMEQREYGNGDDDESPSGVENHYDMAAVFAIDDHAGERHQQHRRKRLQEERAIPGTSRCRWL